MCKFRQWMEIAYRKKEMNYVFLNAGTNGLPNNFFSDSYWGKNEMVLSL